jgi:putative ABC transport system ATP-binding protein
MTPVVSRSGGCDAVSAATRLVSSTRASSGAQAAMPVSVAYSDAVAIFRNMSLIITKQLTQTYTSAGRPLTVLADVDLTIEPESFTAIVGPSGSGKTTLLGLLAGLDRPTSGTVLLNDQDLSALTDDQRARFRALNVGFVFQTFQLIPTLTALENVMVPIELAGGSAVAEAEARALRLLGNVGLADRVEHYPMQLSGGEQQRVALARAFANQPKVLFADEPTGNLDTETGHRIIDLLVELNTAARTTLILVTHDLELAARAHRVIRLAGGRVISDTRNA